MQIDWWTLGLQALNFLVLVWLLWRFLFKPVRAVIEKRREMADAAFAEADQAKATAEQEAERLKAAKAEVENDRQETLNKLHAEMAEERDALMEKTRQEADKLIEDARAAIADERRRTVAALKEELAATAADLAATLLRGLDAPSVDRAVLHRAERALAELPEGELDRLRGDLAGDGARVTVVTTHRLDGALEEEWRSALARRFGARTGMSFQVDAAILGGVELRFPHAALRFTWAEQLREATQGMAGDDAA